jgi:hypothetical protein
MIIGTNDREKQAALWQARQLQPANARHAWPTLLAYSKLARLCFCWRDKGLLLL